MDKKPNCYKCVHRRNVPGDAHSRCNNFQAKVNGNPTGIKRGWFRWPLNFDPAWLEACDGFSDDKNDNKPDQKLDPIVEIFGMLGGRM